MRLAPEPPALLARLEAGRADALVAALRAAGLAALSVDSEVPSDRDRLVAARFVLSEADAVFTPRIGEALAVAWTDVLAILRGLRVARRETERTAWQACDPKTRRSATKARRVSRVHWKAATASRSRAAR